jgi:2',3'-cyclic-nucleotide 2'-phosphodiesterase (5'-nucleotidase family)
VKEKTFELIDINQLKNESAEVKEQIQRYYDESPLHQVLAQASQPFQGRHPLGNLMTDAFREIHAFDIAFQNWGGIRIIEHPKGDFTMNDVFRLDPFGNNLMVYHMTPEEIRDLLKNSYQPYSKQIDLIPSGLKYKIHTRDGKVRRITLTDMQGKPLDEKRRYKVGMNNYISSSYRFKHSSPSIELPSTTSDALIEYLKQQKTITPHQAPRGVVVEE